LNRHTGKHSKCDDTDKNFRSSIMSGIYLLLLFRQLFLTKTPGMNTIAYLLYIVVTYCITVHVGLSFYRNGRIYILNMLEGDEVLTNSINRLLLTGYYLLNLGYAALMIRSWPTMHSWLDIFVSIGVMTGRIMLILSVIHYANMAAILYYSNKRKHLSHHKN
jgi:hypothetical protein